MTPYWDRQALLDELVCWDVEGAFRELERGLIPHQGPFYTAPINVGYEEYIKVLLHVRL